MWFVSMNLKLVRLSLFFLLRAFAEAASVLPRQGSNETDVHLAVHPQCGPLWGNVSDVNAGLNLANMKTIVSFGVRTRSVHLPECKSTDQRFAGFVYRRRKARRRSARASRRDPSEPVRGRSLNEREALGRAYRRQHQRYAYGLRCTFSCR